jgi:DNA phosphorothioation-dependent restriction protein DptG
MKYYETSALNSQNIDKVFEEVVLGKNELSSCNISLHYLNCNKLTQIFIGNLTWAFF